jgi:predicted phosphodiesterase
MRSKQVHKYDPITGKYIESYKSITEAAKEMICDESTIRKAAKGTHPQAVNHLWSFNKYDSYHDTDAIEDFASNLGIPSNEIVRARVSQNAEGCSRFSLEVKPDHLKSEPDVEKEAFQKIQKQKQRKVDELRVINKNFREYARVENTLTALNEELNKLLTTTERFQPVTYEHPDTKGTVLIVQVTDAHFNELVELPDNKFDFVVGAKRMQKYAHKVRKLAEVYGASQIVVAMTGDMINSDRRLDEKMHMATNRTKASLIATEILFHFLQDINRAANLKIVCVSGNESRINEEWAMSELTMSDNYDFLIFNMLKKMFRNAPGVEFIDGDPVEQVINVNNCNFLVTHGTTIKEGQAAMQQVFGKYSAKGILLDYAIYGHVHFTNVTDIYSRSGSIVGNSIYSDRYLNLVTKASQLVHVVETDGSIDNVKISLQYVDGYDGYDIEDDISAYNAKMADNAKQRETIVRVVV